MSRALRILAAFLNLALALLLGALAVNLADARLVFFAGENFFDYLLRALSWAFCARAAVALAEAPSLRTGPFWKRGASLAAIALAVASMHYLLTTSLTYNAALFLAHRAGRRAPTDEQALGNTFEYDRWEHRPSFVYALMRDVPEDEGILYFGDLEPYVLAAQLYPRPVYMPQEIVHVVFEKDQFDWADRDDPMHPPVRRFSGKPVGYEDPAILEELKAIAASRGARWAVVYDALYPEYTIWQRLPEK